MSENSVLGEEWLFVDGGVPELEKIQCNRYPMLFLDSFNVESGTTVRALKAFTYNEWFFPPHFPGNPNVPGFVLFEAMAQSLLVNVLNNSRLFGSETLFLDAHETKFRSKVAPGQVIIFEATLEKYRRGLAEGRVSAWDSGEIVCSTKLKIGVEREMIDLSTRMK